MTSLFGKVHDVLPYSCHSNYHKHRFHRQAYNEALEVNYLMNKEHVIEHLQRRFEEDLKTLDSAGYREKEFLQMIIGTYRYKFILKISCGSFWIILDLLSIFEVS